MWRPISTHCAASPGLLFLRGCFRCGMCCICRFSSCSSSPALCMSMPSTFTNKSHTDKVQSARGFSSSCRKGFQHRRKYVPVACVGDVLSPTLLEPFTAQTASIYPHCILRGLLAILLAFFVVLSTSIAHAEDSTFKTLLMPGKLIQGHAK